MKLSFGKKTSQRVVGRLKNRLRIRKKISGTDVKPRLCVFKSSKHIYAQLIDDVSKKTIASASTLKANHSGNRDGAKEVGKVIAQAAKSANIETVVFDRGGYVYHGRIKALADGAREAGLKF